MADRTTIKHAESALEELKQVAAEHGDISGYQSEYNSLFYKANRNMTNSEVVLVCLVCSINQTKKGKRKDES